MGFWFITWYSQIVGEVLAVVVQQMPINDILIDLEKSESPKKSSIPYTTDSYDKPTTPSKYPPIPTPDESSSSNQTWGQYAINKVREAPGFKQVFNYTEKCAVDAAMKALDSPTRDATATYVQKELVKGFASTSSSNLFEGPYSPEAVNVRQPTADKNVTVSAFTAEINHNGKPTVAYCANLSQAL